MSLHYIGKSVLLEKEDERVLVLGDLHIGYEQEIHRAGVGTTFIGDMCTELTVLFNRIGHVSYCVLLGDVIHRFARAGNDEWRGVREVFTVLQNYGGMLVVVKGNHDVSLAPLLKEFHLSLVDSWTWEGYCCAHGDRDLPALHALKVHTWVFGHGHPAYRLREGAKSELYKCFLEGRYKGKKVILMPSFFQGVIGTDVGTYDLPYPWAFSFKTFTFHLVGENGEVMNFGKLLDT